jgi:hypothetical protein
MNMTYLARFLRALVLRERILDRGKDLCRVSADRTLDGKWFLRHSWDQREKRECSAVASIVSLNLETRSIGARNTKQRTSRQLPAVCARQKPRTCYYNTVPESRVRYHGQQSKRVPHSAPEYSILFDASCFLLIVAYASNPSRPHSFNLTSKPKIMSLALAIGLAFLASRRVVGQEACTSDQVSSASSQFGIACESVDPSCRCNYRTEDQSLSQDICEDSNSYCSGLDATSCGTQRSWTNRYDDGTVTYGYEWTYKSGAWSGTRLVSFMNYDQRTCSFQIVDDNSGTSYNCGCESGTCSAHNSEVWNIDCTGYSGEAYADGCLATWGITSGVLEGWAIPEGLCNVYYTTSPAAAPVSPLAPVKPETPVAPVAPVTVTRVPAKSTGKIVGIVVGALVVVVGICVGVSQHREHPENLATESSPPGRQTSEPGISIKMVTNPDGTKARNTSKTSLDTGGNRVDEEVTEVLEL